VFKGKTVHQQADFKFIDVEEKLAPFRFSTPLCTIRPYTARPSCKTLLSMKSASEQNHSIDVLLTLFSILFWFNPVIWLYQSDSQNLNSSRTVKPY
jgi:hypothetical protein